MMHLSKRLRATGVSLDREIGVIVEEKNPDGQSKVTCARIARVYTGNINELGVDEGFEDFDPESEIAVLWGTKKMQVCVFSMTDSAVVDEYEGGGIIIESIEARIIIGQSDKFMNFVCELMCALVQPT